jgi:glycerophosphoryl diester phosphodiesterase
MRNAERFEASLQQAIDAVYARLPRHPPTPEALRRCRIISHRGEHDNRTILENTLPAFDAALHSGLWGIELDVRWTSDGHPVAFHDADCARLFGCAARVGACTWQELHARFPAIPRLEEVITRYGRRLHLMVEMKGLLPERAETLRGRFKELFGRLRPGEDFHILSLVPDYFTGLDFLPREIFLPIARYNVRGLSRLALQEGYGGLTGHYLLVTQALIRRHAEAGQRVGTGFVDSVGSLYREIQRGVEWVFANGASRLETARRAVLEAAGDAAVSAGGMGGAVG